jgi:valine--tRNA ligase
MTNINDWCISRQLWWGHRIPAYFLPEGGYVVAETQDKALELAKEKTGNSSLTLSDLRQDDDCLDTWFSSWLWPISLFNGILEPDNKDMKYYYPTSDLVTAPDIIFFWVARMIIAGYEYEHKKPFNNVYFTGIVRDKLGRKMSKSLGNSPDPLELIQKYGADGVRMGLMLAAPAGNDIPYDDALCEQGRNFNNKIWNAFRLVKGWDVEDIEQPEYAHSAVKWFESTINATLEEVKDLFGKFRLSEALMAVYKLFWDEFSSWYLEMIKPAYQKPIDRKTYEATLGYFDTLLRLLHPFMPFITEELWQHISNRKDGESIMYASIPESGKVDKNIVDSINTAKEIIAGVRTIRLQKNIPNKETLKLQVIGKFNNENSSIIKKLANLSDIEEVGEKDPTASTFLVGTTEYSVPLGNNINIEEELNKLETELTYLKGFLKSIDAKLSNEKFVNNAPAQVVDGERKKKSDTESKIKTIEESISKLKSC